MTFNALNIEIAYLVHSGSPGTYLKRLGSMVAMEITAEDHQTLIDLIEQQAQPERINALVDRLLGD